MTPGAVHSAATRRKLRAAWVLILATALPAEAQRAREEGQLATERTALEQRGREVLHHGEPLQLVGVGAGDPSAFTRTPALAGATLGLVHVDRDELRARKLAMYEGSERFDTPLRSNEIDARVAPTSDTRRVTTPAPEVTPETRDGARTVWPWVAGALVVLVCSLARVARSRAPRPTESRKT